MWEFCAKHQALRVAGDPCALCQAELAAQQRRQAQEVLEARISDLEERVLRTNRIVAELVRGRQADQRAHNALAQAAEQLLSRCEQILAHIQPREELLP